tara:strand:- start:1694 stop:2323 length:630 start_codon:yes stop_codon:yes gene_type:complete
MDSLKKIKELLKFTKKKTYKINMYAEAILDDARVIATDSEQFEIGAEVYVINDEGAVESLSEGIYTMEDGSKIRIDAESRVAGFGEEEEVVEEEVTEEVVEELAEESVAEDTDWAKTFEEMKDRVAELEKAVFGEKAAEDTEDLNKTEMSADIIGELTTEIESLKSKIVELSEQPASQGVSVSPNTSTESVNLSKLSVKERVAYFINKN